MSIRCVHFSDFHGQLQTLPEGDLYVCTGDMLPNTRACFWVDKEPERRFQLDWAQKNTKRFSALIKAGAPIICVRGNHDYIDLAPLFAEAYPIEFKDPEVIDLFGLKIGGFRGVPPINGDWADEMGEKELEFRCQALGKVDVLVTHSPPYGWLDNPRKNFGSRAIRDYVENYGQPKVHLFGHIHEAAGQLDTGHVQLSNAACQINVLEI